MSLVRTVRVRRSLHFQVFETRGNSGCTVSIDAVPESEKTARFLELEELQTSIQKKIYDGYVGRTRKRVG